MVYKLSRLVDQQGVEPQVIGLDRSFHITVKHLLPVSDAAFIAADTHSVGIMDKGLPLRDTILFRIVPPEIQFKLASVDETGGISDDRAQITLILPVATQLSFPVFEAGNQNIIERDFPIGQAHSGMETHLPAAVLQGGRHNDLELEPDLPAPFRDIAESGRHPSALKGLAGHHFASRLVADGIHDEHVIPVEILKYETVCRGLHDIQVFKRAPFHLRQGQLRRHLLLFQLLHTGGSRTGFGKESRQQQKDGRLDRLFHVRIYRSTKSVNRWKATGTTL